jgi:hypothetical protein
LSAPPSGAYAGIVTLVRDPVPFGAGQRAEVRIGDAHVDAVAFGAVARKLARHLAGEQLHVEGRVGSLPERSRARRNNAHVVAQMSVTFGGESGAALVGTRRAGIAADRAIAVRRFRDR